MTVHTWISTTISILEFCNSILFFSSLFNPQTTDSCLHCVCDTQLKEQLEKKLRREKKKEEIVGETNGVEISKVNQCEINK